MKNLFLMLISMFAIMTQAQIQDLKPIPMINVSGEGKIKTSPDQGCITISQETKGAMAVNVKKENDAKIEAILKFIKKMNIAQSDYLTQRVALNPNFDYETKKQEFIATQTVSIFLRDLSKYDALMNGLVENGVNKIDNVEFKSSKIVQLQSDARKLAIKDAKIKAEDYVSVLGQKVGKALTISDTTTNYNPQPVMYASMKVTAMKDSSPPRETLAAGEIEVVVNVSVSFILE
ncbi:MAG: SIMPL domain-containing protein [Flavobacterium sp.]|nr:SIMPL domain-containing protein [Flavobacterium sp.]